MVPPSLPIFFTLPNTISNRYRQQITRSIKIIPIPYCSSISKGAGAASTLCPHHFFSCQPLRLTLHFLPDCYPFLFACFSVNTSKLVFSFLHSLNPKTFNIHVALQSYYNYYPSLILILSHGFLCISLTFMMPCNHTTITNPPLPSYYPTVSYVSLYLSSYPPNCNILFSGTTTNLWFLFWNQMWCDT